MTGFQRGEAATAGPVTGPQHVHVHLIWAEPLGFAPSIADALHICDVLDLEPFGVGRPEETSIAARLVKRTSEGATILRLVRDLPAATASFELVSVAMSPTMWDRLRDQVRAAIEVLQRTYALRASRGNLPLAAEPSDVYGSPPSAASVRQLGLLGEFPGRWFGRGFNLFARPDQQLERPFVLELNATWETLEVSVLEGDIVNRGSAEDDAQMAGVHYRQQIADAEHGTRIKDETGHFLRVPPMADLARISDTYVRQSVVHNGVSLLASSVFATVVAGAPIINPVDSTPFTGAIGDVNTPGTDPVAAAYLAPFTHRPLPGTMDQHLDASDRIKNPAQLLLDDIAGQTINETTIISMSTAATDNGILTIPFLTANVNAVRLDAIFWIEKVQHPNAGEVMQLQYVQRVIMDFDGIHWPHISVATLRKA